MGRLNMNMKSLYERANTFIKSNEPFNEYNSIIIPVMLADNEIDKDNEMISQSALIKLLDSSIGHSAIISIPEIYDNIITVELYIQKSCIQINIILLMCRMNI